MCRLRSEQRVRWRLPFTNQLLTNAQTITSFPVMSNDLGVNGCRPMGILFPAMRPASVGPTVSRWDWERVRRGGLREDARRNFRG
jgi:hypothetical protein